MSHPSWVCGLKLLPDPSSLGLSHVTPFVGVWIETKTNGRHLIFRPVTPFVGVWIELGYLLVTPCPNRGTCINLCLGIDVSG